MAMPVIRPDSSRRSLGSVHGGRSTAAPAANAAAAVACGIRKRRLAIVGGIIVNSPSACMRSASAGRTHRLSTVSLSSCNGS
jgi:hypothetical protein